MSPPKLKYTKIKLPLTNLHYVTCGKGEPLIMVPATISKIEYWEGLIQFMGADYKAHFFDLPGHGKSTAFKKKFTSDQVAETVEHFVDKLGYKKFNIMGFSFGGVLTMKTLKRLQHRIDKVILVAPCVTHRALTSSKLQVLFIKSLAKIMKYDRSQKFMLKVMHNKTTVEFILWLIRTIGHAETYDELRQKLLKLEQATLDVLVYQINEVVRAEFDYKPFKQKLYFGMSVNDPVLEYTTTLKTLEKLFPKRDVVKFDFPWHQPPEPFTFKELITDFAEFREIINKK